MIKKNRLGILIDYIEGHLNDLADEIPHFFNHTNLFTPSILHLQKIFTLKRFRRSYLSPELLSAFYIILSFDQKKGVSPLKKLERFDKDN